MKHRTTTRSMFALSIAVGMTLCAGQALAGDPPPGTHAATHDSSHPVSDTWITTKVKSDLLTSAGVPGDDVSVTTVNGVVTLSGHVQNRSQYQKAVATAKSIDGVKRVDTSALEVDPSMAKRH